MINSFDPQFPLSAPIFFLGVAGFFIALSLFYMARPFALKVGLVDKPGGRKQHEGVIPLIGGLVIILTFMALGLVSRLNESINFLPLMGGVLFLLTVGTLDDKFHIHAWVRFVIQIWVSCYIVIFCGAEIENLGNLLGFGDINLGYISKPFSVTCFVLLMNAINMMDGLDGLAGGFMAIVLGWLAFVYYEHGAFYHTQTILLLLAPLLSFLFLNMRHIGRKKASVFLGDAGSLSLGMLVGFFTIAAAKGQGAEFILSPVAIIWFVGVPVIDAFSLFFVRLKRGGHPFEADRLHLHYKLVDRGIVPQHATPLILALCFVFCAIGYFGTALNVPEFILTYSWTALLLGYTFYNLKYDAKA